MELIPVKDGVFLPTPSARRATLYIFSVVYVVVISTHALREEGDAFIGAISAQPSDFYPRPPRGGRRPRAATHRCHRQFLPTPSARRATPIPLPVSGWRS